jgi:drug/metabolite transporter (DMT)-like permease
MAIGILLIFASIVLWAIGDLMNIKENYPIESIIMFITGSGVLVIGLIILHREWKDL